MFRGNGRFVQQNNGREVTKPCALVIGAHPDDNMLGTAGFLAKMASNWRIVSCTATRGERGGDPVVREAEDRLAAKIIGVEQQQWDFRDCEIPLPQAIDIITATIRALQPQIVLTHALEDSHQDHRTLSEAANSACRQTGVLLHYEGPTTINFKPQLELDITPHWDIKRSSLQAYASEMSRGEFHLWAERKALDRAWPRHKGGYVEAFEVKHADVEILGSVLFAARIAYQETLVNA
jgi:LmbE family N-acetylglucosaminyl deacetylase